VRLSEVKRLRPGDIVEYGDRRAIRDCKSIDWGVVRRVTADGGVLIEPEWGADPVWRPYSSLIRHEGNIYSLPWDAETIRPHWAD
jgi:hypothetical protein